MPDVILIGGGLSGLSASHELERAAIDYTLIEVKPRLGGSIETTTTEGWRLDASAFMVRPNLDDAWLDGLGLADALHIESPDRASFKQGTGALVDALTRRISAPRMTRMAVASIGILPDAGEWGVCLENGLMLTARAVILALPAMHATRILHNVDAKLSELLSGFHYDTVQRVNLGIPIEHIDALRTPFDMAYAHRHLTTHPDRAPRGQALLQLAMRIGTPRPTQSPKLLISAIQKDLGLPERPTLLGVHHWASSDLLTCYDETHQAYLDSLAEHLPERLALIGSDYMPTCAHQQGVYDLGERIHHARAQTRRILAQL